MAKNSNSGQKFISRNRKPRVHITYEDPYDAEKLVELPFVMGVMADLSGNASHVAKPDMDERKFLDIDMDNFDKRMAAIEPGAGDESPQQARRRRGDDKLSVNLKFNKMEDFSPAAIARQVPATAKLLEAREQLSNLLRYMDGKVARRGHAEETARRSAADGGDEDEARPEAVGDGASRKRIRGPQHMATQQQQKEGVAGRPTVAEADDFAALLKQNFKPRSERAATEVENAVQTLVTQALADSSLVKDDVIDTIEEMIARLDEKLSAQMNEILHAPEFQQLESAWRGLHYLVFNSETDATLKIRV